MKKLKPRNETTPPPESPSSSASAPRRREAVVDGGWPTARAEFAESGFTITDRPGAGGPPSLSDIDITDIGEQELMKLMNELLAWHDYASFLAVRCEVEENDAEARMKLAESRALVLNWGSGKEDRVAVARAQRDYDPDVLEMHDALLKAYARRKLFCNQLDALERKVNLVSRELTRRTSIDPGKRRGNRWGGA